MLRCELLGKISGIRGLVRQWLRHHQSSRWPRCGTIQVNVREIGQMACGNCSPDQKRSHHPKVIQKRKHFRRHSATHTHIDGEYCVGPGRCRTGDARISWDRRENRCADADTIWSRTGRHATQPRTVQLQCDHSRRPVVKQYYVHEKLSHWSANRCEIRGFPDGLLYVARNRLAVRPVLVVASRFDRCGLDSADRVLPRSTDTDAAPAGLSGRFDTDIGGVVVGMATPRSQCGLFSAWHCMRSHVHVPKRLRYDQDVWHITSGPWVSTWCRVGGVVTQKYRVFAGVQR